MAEAQPVKAGARTLESLNELNGLIGQEIAVTDWFTMTQERVNLFADATLDHQWIHVDPERARRESPFGGPIAHGFLTLSLLAHFMQQAVSVKGGVRMGVNYGLNKVRFVSPVKVGSNIRARFTLASLKEVEPNGMEALYTATVEGENAVKPHCVAEWLVRYYR